MSLNRSSRSASRGAAVALGLLPSQRVG
jgi:hypothetical protein